MSDARPAAVVVLAAGEGIRMRSVTAKVLHEICGRPLLGHVLAATAALGADRTLVVVGPDRSDVSATLHPAVSPVVQQLRLGTGHAVRVALESAPDLDGTVVVVPGDAPLLTAALLQGLVDDHHRRAAAATVLTATVPDPTGYGRVLRDPTGAVSGIIEERDADDGQRAIREIGTGVYAFDSGQLRAALGQLETDNAQGEEYLTDVIAILARAGARVGAVAATDYRETLGVNDRVQLAQARALLRDRLLRGAMLAGVTVIDPATTWLDVQVDLEPDVVVAPNVALCGHTVVERGAVVGPNVTLTDTTVRVGAWVREATCEGADIGPAATVGPYTYLRPGTRLGRGAKAGGFVEMKAADVGDGAKVPHLSYVGDTTIGAGSNIGAATVFVNYDGVRKHRTVIGAQARIGSNTMLVAPVEVGDGAYTAAGSVITESLPAGSLGVGRARQRTIEDWVERKRPGSPAAEAARLASRQPSDGQEEAT